MGAQCEGKMSKAVRIIALRMHSPIDVNTVSGGVQLYEVVLAFSLNP